MSKKSLEGRCIRRWKVRFKPLCDSKLSPYWRSYHLNGLIRSSAQCMAENLIIELAEDFARADFGITGWSHEFSQWFNANKDRYIIRARQSVNAATSNDEIDDLIAEELSEWC